MAYPRLTALVLAAAVAHGCARGMGAGARWKYFWSGGVERWTSTARCCRGSVYAECARISHRGDIGCGRLSLRVAPARHLHSFFRTRGISNAAPHAERGGHRSTRRSTRRCRLRASASRWMSVGQAEPFVETAQVATNFKQQLMATLPSNRTMDAVLLMAPAVHPTGPRGAYTINGSQSYENLYILNGAVINENLRGLPMTPYIEDAIQEVTVSSAGVSAEYGRFSGGVATAVTKSGGNTFSGSFRTSFANDDWRSLTPFQTTQLLTTSLTRSQLKADKVVPTYEGTAGGPLLEEPDVVLRCGAVAEAGRAAQHGAAPTSPTSVRNEEQRYEGKLSYTPESGHSLQGSFFKLNQTIFNSTAQQVADLKSLTPQGQPQSMVIDAVHRRAEAEFLGVGHVCREKLRAHQRGRRHDGSDQWDARPRPAEELALLEPDVLLRIGLRRRRRAAQQPELHREGLVISSRTAPTVRTTWCSGTTTSTTTSSRTRTPRAATTGFAALVDRAGRRDLPGPVAGHDTTLDKNPLFALSEGSNLRVHSLFINDTWRLNDRVTFNVGMRLDKNDATDGDGKMVGERRVVQPAFLGRMGSERPTDDWSLSGSYRALHDGADEQPGRRRRPRPATPRRSAGCTAARRSTPNVTDATTSVGSMTTEAAMQADIRVARCAGRRYTAARSLGLVPGVNMTIDEPLTSPYAIEYAGGVSRTLGHRGTAARRSRVSRLPELLQPANRSRDRERVTDANGNMFDRNVVENTNSDRAAVPRADHAGELRLRSARCRSAATTRCRTRRATSKARTAAAGRAARLVNNYPGIPRRVVELSRRRSGDRSAPSRADVGNVQRAGVGQSPAR